VIICLNYFGDGCDLANFDFSKHTPLILWLFIFSGPRFKGQIHVMQSLEIPPLPPIKELKPVVHNVPENLKQRFEPFGSGINFNMNLINIL
jgi:hypothetical protein